MVLDHFMISRRPGGAKMMSSLVSWYEGIKWPLCEKQNLKALRMRKRAALKGL